MIWNREKKTKRSPLEAGEMSRRRFLGTMLLGFLLTAGEGAKFDHDLHRAEKVEVTHQKLFVKNLPKSAERTFLVHITDVHLGDPELFFQNPEKLEKLVVEINEELAKRGAEKEKTYVLNTGDMVTKMHDEFPATHLDIVEKGFSALNKIRARKKFFVEGNHEARHPDYFEILNLAYNYGHNPVGTPFQSQHVFNRPNEFPLPIIALPDFSQHECDWYQSEEALRMLEQVAALPEDIPKIVLSHEASVFDIWMNGKFGKTLKNVLAFCGHTHGGQIAANTILTWFAQKEILDHIHYFSRFIHGLYRFGQDNSNQVFVSPGVGHSPHHGPRTQIPRVMVFELVGE